MRPSQTCINPGITQCPFTINVKPDTIYLYQKVSTLTQSLNSELSMPQLGHDLVNYQFLNLDTIS